MGQVCCNSKEETTGLTCWKSQELPDGEMEKISENQAPAILIEGVNIWRPHLKQDSEDQHLRLPSDLYVKVMFFEFEVKKALSFLFLQNS